MKLRLARIAAAIERRIDPIIWRTADAPEVIEPYVGYATPDHLVVRGRVLSSLRQNTVRDGQSKLSNLRQMLRLFMTDEVAGVDVTSGAVSTTTDEEGYFTLLMPRGAQTGWTEISVQAEDVRAVCPVMIGGQDAKFGVISDIDDTLMQTGAYSLWRNLWTSMTGNALTRKVFPDAIELMGLLHADGRNPVYYVSSSPWNLHGFLAQVFERSGLPPGPMFLRDYGISETQFITGTHGDHKGSAIDRILAAKPDLSFILIGDTGQHDGHVYYDAAVRHPDRISRVVLRAAGEVDADDMAWVGKIMGLGVPVAVGSDYADVIAALK